MNKVRVGKKQFDNVINNNNYTLELVNVKYKQISFDIEEYSDVGQILKNYLIKQSELTGLSRHEIFEQLLPKEYRPTFDFILDKEYADEDELFEEIYKRKMVEIDENKQAREIVEQKESEGIGFYNFKRAKNELEHEKYELELSRMLNKLGASSRFRTEEFTESIVFKNEDYPFILVTDNETGEQGMLDMVSVIDEEKYKNIVIKYIIRNKKSEVFINEFNMTKSYVFCNVEFPSRNNFNQVMIEDYTQLGNDSNEINFNLHYVNQISSDSYSDLFKFIRSVDENFNEEYYPLRASLRQSREYRISEPIKKLRLSFNLLLIKRLIDIDDKNNISYTENIKTDVTKVQLMEDVDNNYLYRDSNLLELLAPDSKPLEPKELYNTINLLVREYNLDLLPKVKNNKPFVNIELKKRDNNFLQGNSRLIKQLSLIGDINYHIITQKLDTKYLKTEEDKKEINLRNEQLREKYKDSRNNKVFNVLGFVNEENIDLRNSKMIVSRYIGSNDEILKLIYSDTFHELYPIGTNVTVLVHYLENNMMQLSFITGKTYEKSTKALVSRNIIQDVNIQEIYGYNYDKIFDMYSRNKDIHEFHREIKEKNVVYDYFTGDTRLESAFYNDILVFRNDIELLFDNVLCNISDFLSFTHLLESLVVAENYLVREMFTLNKLGTSISNGRLKYLLESKKPDDVSREKLLIEHDIMRELLESVE